MFFHFLSFSIVFVRFLLFVFHLSFICLSFFFHFSFIFLSFFFHFLSFSFIFFHFLSFSFIFFHFLSFSFSLLGAQNLFFLSLNFVTISLDSSYVKNQFLGPSRVVAPFGPSFPLFLPFFFFFFLSFFLLFIFHFSHFLFISSFFDF